MRDDITIKEAKECYKELEQVFANMIDTSVLQEAYNTFRKKTGMTIESFKIPILEVQRATDMYIGETAIIGEPRLEYDGKVYV